jgi:hypothetical protein
LAAFTDVHRLWSGLAFQPQAPLDLRFRHGVPWSSLHLSAKR